MNIPHYIAIRCNTIDTLPNPMPEGTVVIIAPTVGHETLGFRTEDKWMKPLWLEDARLIIVDKIWEADYRQHKLIYDMVQREGSHRVMFLKQPVA